MRKQLYADVREICTYAREDIRMFREFRKEIEWGGKPLILETGKVARQADGCVIVTYGESTVLCAVVGERQPKPGLDFFPLTVHYVEKAYAAGKIPGGFFQAGGPPDGERNARFSPHRPAHPSAVREGFQERNPSYRPGPVPRSGERNRRAGDDCRVRRVDHLRPAVHGPYWRLPGRT